MLSGAAAIGLVAGTVAGTVGVGLAVVGAATTQSMFCVSIAFCKN